MSPWTRASPPWNLLRPWAKRAGLCQLRGLLVSAPERLRAELRSVSRAQLLRRLAAVRPVRRRDPEPRGTLLAREIEKLTRTLAPPLLEQPGVGPLAAAQVLLSWSDRGRIRSEPPSLALPAAPRSPPPPDKPSVTASTAAAIGVSTAHSTRSSSRADALTLRRSPTSSGESTTATVAAKQTAASSATSPPASADSSSIPQRQLDAMQRRASSAPASSAGMPRETRTSGPGRTPTKMI